MTRGRQLVSVAVAVVLVGAAVAGGALFLGSAKAAVGPMPGEALLLPADAKFVGGIDVRRFVQSPFYVKYASPQAKGRPETFRELEEKTGLNPERDLDQVIFAGTPPSGTSRESGVVVALGRFDRAKISQTIEQEKKGVTSKNVQGITLYMFQEGQKGASAIAFVDDRTLVMGTQAAVEAAILSQSQGGKTLKQNASIMALLERVRPDATFWGVGDQSLFQNMPKDVQGPGGTITLPGLRAMTVAGDMDPMVAVEITGDTLDEAAAKNLADVVRGFVALAALQSGQKPELKELASSISVSTEANQVRVNARVPYEVLDALQPKSRTRSEGSEPEARK
jgi:hypothetical protein